jgi:lipoate-protein ligase A
MKTIINNSTDPFFNLALEEYLLKKVDFEDDLFFLWRNKKCVILGRNQNPFNEVNIEYANKNDIDIVRRSTGGGTVYHDEGNINFTFITSKISERLHNYEFFVTPIIEALNKLGIPARFEPKTHIYVGEHKVSGNAQTYYKNKMIHHGTLLFDVETHHLNSVLQTKAKIDTHAIPSQHSSVSNLKDLCRKEYSILEFMDFLLKEMSIGKTDILELSNDQISEVHMLSNSKYRSWDWIFGQTPKFTIQKGEYQLEVSNGHITNSSHFKDLLVGIKYSEETFFETVNVKK